MMQKAIAIALLAWLINPAYGQTEIRLEDYFRGLKTVKVKIEDKTYDFLFDTGGGITFISPSIAGELGKDVYGHFVGYRMSGKKVEMKLLDSLLIKIGGINFYHSYVGVFDMMSLLPEGFERIDGIISLKTFENNEIALNLSENKLVVETEDSFKDRIKNMHLIRSRFANGPSGSELNIFIGIRDYGRVWWFLFDTGNISEAKISKNVVPDWDLSYQGNETTGIGSYEFKIDGAWESISAPAIVDDIIYDGAMSYDFIRQTEYAISLKDKKIWIGKIFHNVK